MEGYFDMGLKRVTLICGIRSQVDTPPRWIWWPRRKNAFWHADWHHKNCLLASNCLVASEKLSFDMPIDTPEKCTRTWPQKLSFGITELSCGMTVLSFNITRKNVFWRDLNYVFWRGHFIFWDNHKTFPGQSKKGGWIRLGKLGMARRTKSKNCMPFVRISIFL